MQEVLVNRLFKLAQEKVWLGEADRSDMTIAVDWEVKQQAPKNDKTNKVACALNERSDQPD